MIGVGKKLGELLVDDSYISELQLEQALSHQKLCRVRIGEALVDLGFARAWQVNEALSKQAGIEMVDLAGLAVSPDAIAAVPAELVSRHKIFPFAIRDGRLSVAMNDPFDVRAIAEIRVVCPLGIRRHYARTDQLEEAILKYYGSNVARMLDDLVQDDAKTEIEMDEELTAARLQELAREPSLVNLVNLILLEAIDARASDIHIEPFEGEVKIKYRIDGMLIEKSPSPKKLQAAIISRIKIMAGMNIAERFIPQDGHIEFSGNRGKIDIRVSTVPTIFGEAITMRILDRSAALIGLDELGMNRHMLSSFRQSLNKSHGLVLVTGPTGSGKTTTLYAALNSIYTPSVKIITIEDPVEYQLNGIIQIPVNPRRGLTFARGLRHILRQDPDIVMVGEIRDKETADIAIRAALTGHLVFSTLHTNDAAGAITRLIDMGIEPFLLASSIEGVLAQRLVRRVCSYCRVKRACDERILANLNNSVKIDPDKIYYGKGCTECNGTGMRGRVGIFELLRVTESIRKLIGKNPSSEEIVVAAPEDHVDMRHDGIEKILAGVTTPEEVFRATQANED
ncbi:MAG: ATPase, T2SS/T4P/T4SS family [Phycisphaerae bacterium]|nr:ATPase, T2SS/T4P/T4SS family [Phycisphaerae bacterium]